MHILNKNLESAGIYKYFIVIAILIIYYLTFMGKIERVVKINMILIPFIIFMILLILLKSDIFYSFYDINKLNIFKIEISKNWFLSSLEYIGYNTILLIPILIELKIYTLKKEVKIAFLASIIFLTLSIIVYCLLSMADVKSMELPLIYIVKQYGSIYGYMYGIAVCFAIYTSAVSAGYSFIKNCSKDKKTYKYLSIFICISAIFVLKIGFSRLMDLLYPVFGLLGIIQILYIFLKVKTKIT